MAKTERKHWVDVLADKIIREKGDKARFVCAAGITPSGVVHIGNFREIITVDLVARALQERGKEVDFLYSWDDYDVFRKVPKNMPQPDILQKYLRRSIVDVPDTTQHFDNYALANEKALEQELPHVGIYPRFIYQHIKYRNGDYNHFIALVLRKREAIRTVLNSFRTSDLADDWLPISIFCTQCHTDRIVDITYDEAHEQVAYTCECGHNETVALANASCLKLPWRIDWPMRWVYEQVDFEPGGKEHLGAGGSFDTASEIVKVLDGHAPVTAKYDFITKKGGGKMSSSDGDLLSLQEVLTIYTPEIVRYMFVRARLNSEFVINIDEDIIRTYDEYDRCERIYYGLEPHISEKKRLDETRIYELSQVQLHGMQSTMMQQIGFRHISIIAQIHGNDAYATRDAIAMQYSLTETEQAYLLHRIQCVLQWLLHYAPERFLFQVSTSDTVAFAITTQEHAALCALSERLAAISVISEKELHNMLYDCARFVAIEPKDFFVLLYRIVINKQQGPKLAHFLLTIGLEKIQKLLQLYIDNGVEYHG